MINFRRMKEGGYNEKILLDVENRLTDILPAHKKFKNVIKVVKTSDILTSSTLSVIMDGEANEALAYLKPPDHWSWRMQKVEEISESLDPELYGIESIYLIGSTKDGSAGPASDIDLLVHFRGNEEQKDKLMQWFDEFIK